MIEVDAKLSQNDAMGIAQTLDLDVELRRQYRDRLRSDAPSWVYMIHHVEQTMTKARIKWRGPLFDLMPYCLHGTFERGSRCIVNRDYKPIGYRDCSYANYELAHLQHITAAEFETLQAAGVVTDRGYIHDDGTTPRDSKRMFDAYRRTLQLMVKPYLVGAQ